MTSALREHWRVNNNAYPQRFELTQTDLEALAGHRELVTRTMNFSLRTELGQEFLGVPIVVSNDGNAMVALDGTRVPLSS